MKNKHRPQPSLPAPPQQPTAPTHEARGESETAQRASANGKSGSGLPIFLALVIGILLGALVTALRGGGEETAKKIAEDLRADTVRTAERRAERLYLARETETKSALRDFVEILDDYLQHGYGNATALRRKLLVAHCRLAVLLRDVGETEEVKKQVATAAALAAQVGEVRVTNEASLLAFIAEVDSGKPSDAPPTQMVQAPQGGTPMASTAPSVPPPPVAPIPQPKTKGNLVFADSSARADVAASEVFDFGAGDFTWVGFFQGITPPYDHHILIVGHPEKTKFHADFADGDLRVVLNIAGVHGNLLVPFRADVFDGNWHSFIIKREGGIVHAFLDGSPIGSGKREGVSGVHHGWTFGHLNQDNDAQTFIGSLKNFSYWNRALAPREIGDLAKGKVLQGNEPGLVAFWPMDEGGGETIREVVGGRHGTLKGNFEWDRDADRDTKLARELAERLRPFNTAYAAWRKKVEELRGEPIATFIELPEYRAIVALGAPALEGLQRKLVENKGLDFLLADAVIEIARWNKEPIPATDLKERSRLVLERLRKHPKTLRR